MNEELTVIGSMDLVAEMVTESNMEIRPNNLIFISPFSLSLGNFDFSSFLKCTGSHITGIGGTVGAYTALLIFVNTALISLS